ncbi:RNA-binding domain-containing protein [Massarina eburnea CBS 473.64]|uniref:RNA-binding domain-containing protein n=1 Tax=Massarina eburnea CBS 473.64 TaxID=1395130 RepID=A0A6A6RJ72_9PLEO|nr:RNA-binding domain-containing protein [Massarina eburnea CBS 473.64]
MNSIRSIQKLNKRELEEGITPEGSWHTDYRDTAFINVGGLAFDLSEGDIITIFSQYGEPVWIKLARDKETGKSRGFAWLKYEDQRSCDLAVDNLGGATVMDRVLRVDHARYKPRDDEDMRDNTMGEPGVDAGGQDGESGKSESDSDDDRPLLPEEIELEKAIIDLDEEDPMKASMVKRLREKADGAVKKYKKSKRKEKERSRRHEKRHKRDRSNDDRSKDRDRERRRIKERGESDDEDRHRSSRRRREGSEIKERDGRRDRDRSDRHRRGSRERRRHSSEKDDYKSRPRRSQSPAERPRRDHGRQRDDSSRD